MSAHPIERILMPDPQVFFRDYVQTRTPVIVTDLFKGQPIRSIATAEQAMDAFAGIQLEVQTEYAVAAARPEAALHRTMSFADYWRHVRTEPGTPLLCTEYEIPARISMLFKLPAFCMAQDLQEEEVLSLPRKYGDHDLCANLFVANRGNRAHLHFDGDQRQVLLYQIFGRKEVILFEPDRCASLRTLEGAPWSAGVFLEDMTREERLALVERVGGHHAVLQPGEAVYMPKLVWHYLDYTDDAMSLNLRFRRNRYGRFLCVDNFHRDSYIQNFASRLTGDTALDSKFEPAMRAIVSEYLRPSGSLHEKVRRMRDLFRDICQQLLPDIHPERFCPSAFGEAEIGKILRDVGETARYMEPGAIALSRPTGPITPGQKQTIEKTAARRGYSAGVLEQLLVNRLGKSHVDLLTRTEAIQFMTYMRSPGAAW
jgi:hypothetical protein